MFKYEVTYWDSDSCTSETGLTGTKKWGKACKKIRKFYGKNNVISIQLTPYEDILYAEELIEDFEKSLAAE